MPDVGFGARRFLPILVVVSAGAAIVFLAATRGQEPQDLAPVRINEIVASNASTLLDDDGEPSDWVELHNLDDTTVDLAGYFLSDDPDLVRLWEIPPGTELQPRDHFIVFASGKDRRGGDGELHLDFAISQEGEPITLVAPDGRTVVDRLEAAYVPRDASFGRDPSDLERTCWFAFPTPGAPNSPECFDDERLGAPAFSQDSGFYGGSLELRIQPAHAESQIYYTLDGSYPDPDANAEQTLEYTGPVRIEDRTDEPDRLSTISTSAHIELPPPADPVPKATVVRARTRYSAETVATFFVGDHLRSELPVISIAADHDHLFGHEDGIYVPGAIYEDYRHSAEYDPEHGWDVPGNPRERGREWERPHQDDLRRSIRFLYCDAAGSCDYSTNVGLRIHGGISRTFPIKSLRLYARNDYGARTFEYPFFGDSYPSEHRRLILRAAGNDWRRSLFVDAYAHAVAEPMLPDTQASRPTVVFINGEYWGIHTLRERYDRHYLGIVHDVDPDGVDILGARFEPEEGGPQVAEAFRRHLQSLEALEPAAAVQQAATTFDLDDFVDYVILQIFLANTDWPNNNVRAWRTQDHASTGDAPADGRWRWLIFDLDRLGHSVSRHEVDYNSLARVLADRRRDVDEWSGIPFLVQRLLDDEEFERRFLTTFVDHMNTTFAPERTLPIIDEFQAAYQSEIGRHFHRWPVRDSEEDWIATVDELREFMEQRPGVQRRHLSEAFDLGDPFEISVTASPGGAVRVGSAEVTSGETWRGAFFPAVPVQLEAVADNGHRFVGWEGIPEQLADQPSVQLTLPSSAEIRASFEAR